MTHVVIAKNGLFHDFMIVKPLFAMTNRKSYLSSKNYAKYHTPKHHICQINSRLYL